MRNIVDTVLYKDGMMLVIDKPAGWSCTPTGPGVHLTNYLQALTFGKTTLPQVAHRLDRETTGCLLLGRHPRALRDLGQLFQDRKIRKTYWALVRGHWPEALDRLDQPIQGQEAVTLVKVRQASSEQSWLELEPLTGRTHQLRIHCSQAGFPILGDDKYGGGEGPMKLHARRLEVPLYKKRAPVVVEAPCLFAPE
ncbi:MAG: RluA family pseudouridine synthase [Candidatus Eremiobacteraeota bacterium]|nr:RluA family pseudouridine synthase [Candidatus Eremiobacteraeota bacterium]